MAPPPGPATLLVCFALQVGLITTWSYLSGHDLDIGAVTEAPSATVEVARVAAEPCSTPVDCPALAPAPAPQPCPAPASCICQGLRLGDFPLCALAAGGVICFLGGVGFSFLFVSGTGAWLVGVGGVAAGSASSHWAAKLKASNDAQSEGRVGSEPEDLVPLCW